MEDKLNRGGLYYALLEESDYIGKEQNGIRPVLILQNNVGNRFSPTTIVAPITSKVGSKANLPTHVFIKGYKKRLERDSIVLLEQIRVIDKSRLRYYIGSLDSGEMKLVDKALIIALGIKIEKIKNRDNYFLEQAVSKEEKTEFITRRQIASYGLVAREYLKHVGNLNITNNEFVSYMLTLMELFSPEEIEKIADKYKK